MDTAVEKRREARRRKVLMKSEDRMKKIMGHVEVSTERSAVTHDVHQCSPPINHTVTRDTHSITHDSHTVTHDSHTVTHGTQRITSDEPAVEQRLTHESSQNKRSTHNTNDIDRRTAEARINEQVVADTEPYRPRFDHGSYNTSAEESATEGWILDRSKLSPSSSPLGFEPLPSRTWDTDSVRLDSSPVLRRGVPGEGVYAGPGDLPPAGVDDSLGISEGEEEGEETAAPIFGEHRSRRAHAASATPSDTAVFSWLRFLLCLLAGVAVRVAMCYSVGQDYVQTVMYPFLALQIAIVGYQKAVNMPLLARPMSGGVGLSSLWTIALSMAGVSAQLVATYGTVMACVSVIAEDFAAFTFTFITVHTFCA